MALSDIDRILIGYCLARKEGAWETFVDRYAGLIVHVVNHTARSRSMVLTAADREDLAADVFLAIVDDDFAILRNFQGRSSLGTYLTVIARRIVVRRLLGKREPRGSADSGEVADGALSAEQRISNRDEVDRMLERLDGPDAQVVRMYHLEGKSYQEISRAVGVPEGSVGPVLSRARSRMRAARHAL